MKDSAKPKNEKGEAYALAFTRIKKSIEGKFPVEATALEECIISDRLRSFLKMAMPSLDTSVTAGRLIENTISSIQPRKDPLLASIKNWMKARNKVIHGIITAKGGNIPAKEFISRAVDVAKNGAELARQLCRWVDKEKRQIKQRSATFRDSKVEGV